jgi:phospholipase D1/2
LTGRNLTIDQLNKGDLNCQIVRSAAHWSVGNHTIETSILNAYCDLIDNAKHYIIIENQFFISNTFTKQESGHKLSSKMLNK